MDEADVHRMFGVIPVERKERRIFSVWSELWRAGAGGYRIGDEKASLFPSGCHKIRESMHREIEAIRLTCFQVQGDDCGVPRAKRVEDNRLCWIEYEVLEGNMGEVGSF